MNRALAGYETAAPLLIEHYEAVDPEVLYHPVADVAPKSGETVLDIGAGTGRDAAHWAALGCTVIAVEPAARLWAHPEINVIRDSLPDLAA